MTITEAVLVEAGGGMKLYHHLTPDFQQIDPVTPGIRVRRNGNFVEVDDKGYVTRRGVQFAQEYPIVVDSLLIQGQAAKVVFR